MGKYFASALMAGVLIATTMAGFLIATTSNGMAAMSVYKRSGCCAGRFPKGTRFIMPGLKDACGRPAVCVCGIVPPPEPCSGGAYATAVSAARQKKLIPVDPENRFGNAPIHRQLQVVTHGSPHFDPGALSIDKKRKIKRGLKPIDMNERIQ